MQLDEAGMATPLGYGLRTNKGGKMLNAVSCWYFDWATAGTWVGGLGSALAAGAAVCVISKSNKQQDRRNKALAASSTALFVPELIQVGSLLADWRFLPNYCFLYQGDFIRAKAYFSSPEIKRFCQPRTDSEDIVEAAVYYRIALETLGETVSNIEDKVDDLGRVHAQKHSPNFDIQVETAINRVVKLATLLIKKHPESKVVLDYVLKRATERRPKGAFPPLPNA